MKNVKLLALVPAFVFAACSNGTTGAVSFSLTSRSAGAPAASPAFATAPSPTVAAAGDSTVIALGNDTVIVRSVELVLRQVELKRSDRSEEHTSELQSQSNLVCRLLLEKKKNTVQMS